LPKRRKQRKNLSVPDWAAQHDLWRKFTAEAQRQIIWAARQGEDWAPALSAWGELTRRQQEELGLAVQMDGRWAAVHGLLKDFTKEEQQKFVRTEILDDQPIPASLNWFSLGQKDRAFIAKTMDHFLNYKLLGWQLSEDERRLFAEAASKAKKKRFTDQIESRESQLLEDHKSLFATLKAAGT
jgi:hypothetical protein